MFYATTDLEVAMEWIDSAYSVLAHLSCPLDFWVSVATGAIQQMGRIWWEFAHAAYVKTR